MVDTDEGGRIFHMRAGNRIEEDTDMYIWVMVCIVKNGLGSLNKIFFLLLTSTMYILYLYKFENVILLRHDKVLCVQL